jgi:enamine deaminase RidA (YjgF/YER057c/UK114 family)
MTVYEKLDALHIALPQVTPPVAAFLPFLRTGNLLFLSGHIAKKNNQPWVGQLGASLTTAQGKEAARAVAIDLLGTLHAAAGDLNKIRRMVKLMVLVNSTSHVYRTALGRQRRFGSLRTGVWRYGNARSQRLRRRSSAVRILCGNRPDRGG